MNWWKIANNHMKDTTPPSGNDNSKIDANRFARYTDDEVRKILDRAYKANAPQGIIDELETELDRREREEDDPSGGDDEPNRSNMGYGIEELMRQAALRGRMENMSPAQLGAEIRTDGDFAVMTQASPLATVSDAELGQEAYDALRAHEERIAAIRGRMSNRAHAVPYKMADNHAGDTNPPSGEITAEELAALGKRGNDAADEVENALKGIKTLQERIKALVGDARAKEKAGGKPFAKAVAKLEQAKEELKQAEEDIERLREIAREAKEIADAAWKAAPRLSQQKAMIIMFGTDNPYWYED